MSNKHNSEPLRDSNPMISYVDSILSNWIQNIVIFNCIINDTINLAI
jgi:hypothetical protein